MSVQPEFESDFTGYTLYRSPGLSSAEIRAFLKEKFDWQDQEMIDTKDERGVMKPIRGKFKGTLTMNTQFFVVPADLGIGCLGAAKIFQTGTNQEIQELTNEIHACKLYSCR